MTDFVFNVVKGRIATYAGLPAANDGLVVIPLLAAGLEADATLADYGTVAALLAGTTDENTTMGRKVVSSGVTVTVDNTNDRVDIDMPDQTWSAVAASGAVGALLIAYDPDTTTGDDTTLIPLTKHGFAVTPDGSDITAVVATAGFARAA